MVRTIVSIEDEDKAWLDRRAAEEHVSRAELIRRAVRQYREETDRQEVRPLHRLLEETSGIWKGEDGLAFQLRMRGEWDDR